MSAPTAPRLTSLREYAQAFVTAFDSGRAYKSQLQGLRDALLSVPSPQPETSRMQTVIGLLETALRCTPQVAEGELPDGYVTEPLEEALALLQQET